MNSSQKLRATDFGSYVKAHIFISLTEFLSLAVLLCAFSAQVQADIWDTIQQTAEEIGRDATRRGAEARRETNRDELQPEPSRQPPHQTRAERPSSRAGQPSRPSPDYNHDRQKVIKTQALLRRLGYPVGVVDGVYGPATRRAILAYQADRGLPLRGDVTAALLSRLAAESSPPNVPGGSVSADTRRRESSHRSVSIRQTPTQWYGPEYQQCTRQTTVGLAACIRELTNAWERQLAKAYQALSATLRPGPQRASLQKAQRLWAAYRNANCGFYGAGAGSISRIAAAECMRVMTKDRARELMQAVRP